MATKALLAELARAYAHRSGGEVIVASVGGVDAARRVQAGEAFDLVVLAAEAIDKLFAGGHLVPGSKRDLVHSGVAIALRAGAPRPDVSSEAALQRAVLAARSVGCSSGPSGGQLAKLFERWGIAAQIQDRTVIAPPGVPVGALVARGEVELGFQQLSELMHLEGVQVLGPLPDPVQIVTTFSAGIGAASTQADAAAALLHFMASPEAADAKQRQGMQPA